MNISKEEKAAIGEIVQQKIMENMKRAEFPEGGLVDTQLVYEHVSTNSRVDEALDIICNDMIDKLEETLVYSLSKAITSVTENTSIDDVKMYADNGRDQIEEVSEEVMTVIRGLLETYAKVFTAVVCEVANEPTIADIIDE